MRRPALFLDRDGVINVDHGYVFKREDFEFIEGIFDLVAAATQAGYRVIVITNQAGIGRGYYTESDFQSLTDWMSKRFTEHGGCIDHVYFCPDHPEHGIGVYKRRSEFRKPAPGMILKAARDFDIDLENSILIGDKLSDIEAGASAGVGTLLLYGDPETSEAASSIRDLRAARGWLKTHCSGREPAERDPLHRPQCGR